VLRKLGGNVSRVTKNPLIVPAGIDVTITGQTIKVKGAKGALEYQAHSCVSITKEDKLIKFQANTGVIGVDGANAEALAGTARALVRNMLDGVHKGYEKKLVLIGVGYRAQVQGKVLNLQVGFSHPVKFPIPPGINIEVPSQTEIVIRGIEKQLVGLVAAQIRAYRPPEPYKGKGIRYDGEVVVQKEGKKK
jgi:large subunit ribosomal protein L6